MSARRPCLDAKARLSCIALASLVCSACPGCGGDDQNVPDGAVAVVGGEEITKAEFDALISRAKTSYGQNKRTFPKVGTPEYKTLQNQAVQYLVQQEKYRQKAEDLDVKIDRQGDRRPARSRSRSSTSRAATEASTRRA